MSSGPKTSRRWSQILVGEPRIFSPHPVRFQGGNYLISFDFPWLQGGITTTSHQPQLKLGIGVAHVESHSRATGRRVGSPTDSINYSAEKCSWLQWGSMTWLYHAIPFPHGAFRKILLVPPSFISFFILAEKSKFIPRGPGILSWRLEVGALRDRISMWPCLRSWGCKDLNGWDVFRS